LDFPGSSLREKALFYRFDSAYQLAIKSIESKKQERLEKAQNYYVAFKKLYAQSEFIEEANKMNDDINKHLEQYSTNS
jgi:outer membrane protein assembly factor BamD